MMAFEELKGPLPEQNAFTIMHTQNLLSQPSLQSHVLQRTNKHKMYNDAIDLLDSRNLKFSSNAVDNAGTTLATSFDMPQLSSTNFVNTLVDILWYLDGHHDTLIKQSCPIPSCFANFVGYNKLELH